MKLEWKSYGDNGRTAEGEKGTWRIVANDMWWFLSYEEWPTEAMVNKGKFHDRQDAMTHAQDCEDYADPQRPIQIEPS